MDQDFYIEESSPIKIIITILIIVVLIASGIWSYYNYYAKNKITLKNVTIELGNTLPKDINYYVKGNNLNEYEIDLSKVLVDDNNKVKSIGEYSYKITKNDVIKKGKIFVKDTAKPVATTESITVGINEEYEPFEFVTSCNDLSMPCNVDFKKESDRHINKKAGTYKITIIISDNAHNKLEQEVELVVSETESLEGKKQSDLEPARTSDEKKSWDNTYLLKFEKALKEDSKEYEKELLEMTAREYILANNIPIKSKEIIIIYNKYDYIIGFSIKVTLEDDSTIYLNKENSKEINIDEQNT